MRKLELFENQNFEKDIYKMGFEKIFSKSNKKEIQECHMAQRWPILKMANA